VALTLRAFRREDEAVAVAGHHAFAGEDIPFLLGYEDGDSWEDWIQGQERIRAGIGLPQDWVRAAFLAVDVDGELVGRVSIRFELNDWLARYGGHIGYGILSQYRRKGYATELLRQAVEIAHQENVDRILVICDVNNTGSASVIERCGGVLEGLAISEEGTGIRRYWI
jgi:predicted acetyltransferase